MQCMDNFRSFLTEGILDTDDRSKFILDCKIQM